jgi:hypothetical protein
MRPSRRACARARVVVEGPVDWRVDKSGGGGACFGGEPQ